MQSKQHGAFPFFRAMRVPGGQLSLHTDRGGCTDTDLHPLLLYYTELLSYIMVCEVRMNLFGFKVPEDLLVMKCEFFTFSG